MKLKEVERRKRQASENGRTSGKTGNPDHWDIDTQGSGEREQRCAEPEVDAKGKTTVTKEENNIFI